MHLHFNNSNYYTIAALINAPQLYKKHINNTINFFVIFNFNTIIIKISVQFDTLSSWNSEDVVYDWSTYSIYKKKYQISQQQKVKADEDK